VNALVRAPTLRRQTKTSRAASQIAAYDLKQVADCRQRQARRAKEIS